MRICIIGSGYVGLTTGACLAEIGHVVVCIDKDKEKIQKLVQHLEAPFYEPGLNELIQQVGQTRSSGDLNDYECQLNFTTSYDTIRDTHFDAYFICVGTPDKDGSPDISQVLAAAKGIRENHRSGQSAIVVVKSTVPPGTCIQVEDVLGYNSELHIASNPEFLKEGHAIEDFRRPDRIVVGTNTTYAEEVLRDIYSNFIRNGHKYLEMDLMSAEMVKYASNAMLAVRISFMNEMACICENIGADVMEVRKGMGTDSRIGPAFLYPGLGFGGSCFPKDLKGLIRIAHDCVVMDYPNLIAGAAEDVNKRTLGIFKDKINLAVEGISNPTIAVWGLSFKPKTSDIRNAPARELIKDFLSSKYKVQAYDPVVKILPGADMDRVKFCENKYQAVEGADLLVLCTEWAEFRNPDWSQVKSLMNDRPPNSEYSRGPIVVDGRNQWDPTEMDELGFCYLSFGRRLLPITNRR